MAFDPGHFGIGIDGGAYHRFGRRFPDHAAEKELRALKREEPAKHPEFEAESAAPENQKD